MQSAVRHEYERHHVWGIFLSRCLPIYRAVVPPFAGMMGVSALRAIPAIAAASALFYGAVLFVAYRLGANWNALSHALGDIGILLAGVALLVTALLVAALIRRRVARDG